MKTERSQKEQVKAAMAEFGAAFEKGQRERMAAFLAPEATLHVHDAKGTWEFVGAAAASRSLEGLHRNAHARLGDAKIQLGARGEAVVEAKLERYEAVGAAKFGAQAHAGHPGAHAAHAAAQSAHEAQGAQAHVAYEAHAEAAGMLSAELEKHGEQWRVKAMHYHAE